MRVSSDQLPSAQSPERPPLSRQRVLDAALRLIDQDGLEALSMRRIGAELAVEAMSLYRYFPSKDALLDALMERLWAEVRLPDESAHDWKDSVRASARSLRVLAHAHPNAYSLLLGRQAVPEAAVRLFDAFFKTFRAVGFDAPVAAHALGAVVAYAAGYAMVELSCCLGQPERAAQCWVPADAALRFPEVTRALTECDPEAQFEFGLEAVLAGLEARLQRPGPATPTKA